MTVQCRIPVHPTEARGGPQARLLDQSLQDRIDLVFPGEIVPPFGRDSRLTEPGTGKLATDGARRVGVVTQIHGSEHGLAEIDRIMKRPECRLERSHHVAGAANPRRLPGTKAPLGDLEDFGMQGESLVDPPRGLPARIEHLITRQAVQEATEEHPEIGAGRQALGAGMCGTARFDEPVHQQIELVREESNVSHGNRRQPHDRPVAAARGEGSPEVQGSPVSRNCWSARTVVTPISNTRPLTE